ncbi:FAD-dependent oxidoreductase [Halovenus rubra]|uniref:FAD-dependent oxidoreductase n=2 Tax=Halovenus rubra TaxID=869890 RepID=A0ACC7E083_9EURY|nr:FAD-dependent oxidoreductase [Halovenus rubra]
MGYTPHILVIGGGVIGTGIARDFAIRGLDVTLAERGTLTAGITGRCLGVLYSGARAQSDQLAQRLKHENEILHGIAGHCINHDESLLVTDNEDISVDELCQRLEQRSISYDVLEGEEIDATEPALSDDIDRLIRVPDASVNQFELTIANARSAQRYGAEILTQTEVTDIAVEDGTIDTVTLEYSPPGRASDALTPDEPVADGGVPGSTSGGTMPGETNDEPKQVESGETEERDPDYIINAAGGQVEAVAAVAGINMTLESRSETTVCFDSKPVETPLSRYRSGNQEATMTTKQGTGVLGTVSKEVTDQTAVTPANTKQLVDEMKAIVPAVGNAQQVQFSCGVRSTHPSLANKHEYALIDHGDRHNCWGMTTVVGGSLTTHRYIAERVANEVCAKFGISRECKTESISLPATEEAVEAPDMSAPESVICETHSVTRSDVQHALADDLVTETDLNEVRIRTGVGRGGCKGSCCAHRLVMELYPEYDEKTIRASLQSFLDDLWTEQRGTLHGNQLKRAMQTYIFQKECLNLATPDVTYVSTSSEDEEHTTSEPSDSDEQRINIAAYDSGPSSTARERPVWGERQR